MSIRKLLLALPMLAVLAASGGNLLQNGSFREIGGNGVPEHWHLNAKPENLVAIAGNGVRYPGNGAGHGMLFQEVRIEPGGIYVLKFGARAAVPDPEKEYYGAVLVYYLDGNRQWIDFSVLRNLAFRDRKWPGATVVPDGKYESLSFQFTAPANAHYAGIRFDFSGPVELELADVVLDKPDLDVAGMLDRFAPPADMPEPGAVSAQGATLNADWSNDNAEMKSGESRLSLCLNGLWGYRQEGVDGPWAFLKVPGGIHRPETSVFYNNAAGYRQDFAGPVWLARTVLLPEGGGGRYFLDFEGSRNLALRVFWNGQAIGDIDSDWGGELALPAELALRGTANALLILALPRKSDSTSAYLYDTGKPSAYLPADNSLLFDVTLLRKPERRVFDSMRITPSWRRRQLTVRLDGQFHFRFRAKVTDLNGNALLEDDPEIHHGDGNTELVLNWPEPVEWTPDTPNLLELTLTALDEGGTVVDQSLPERFGFREVWVEGKTMYLNGKELRLRPRQGMIFLPTQDEDYYRRGFSFMKDMGFNTLIRLSSMAYVEDFFEGMTPFRVADELGMFYIAYTPAHMVSGGQFGNESAGYSRALMNYINRRFIEKIYNHPSVIAYSGFGTSPVTDGNLCYTIQPNVWGIAPLDSEESLSEAGLSLSDRQRSAFSGYLKYIEELKRLDASRPYLSHYDCGSGDGWGIFDYFNWGQTQEREEWLSEYPGHGVKPVGSWEHGNPYPESFVNHAIPDGDGEPWVTEYCASIIGDQAYRTEDASYRDKIKKEWYDPASGNYRRIVDNGMSELNRLENVNLAWADINRRIYRSWRLLGANMGIEPFGPADNYIRHDVLFKDGFQKFIADPARNLQTPGAKSDLYKIRYTWPTEALLGLPKAPSGRQPDGLNAFGKVLYENNRDFLGFVADGGENPIGKTHLFRIGETVKKAIALIYDGFTPLSGTIRGKVWQGDREHSEFEIPFEFPAARTELVPFDFPAEIAGSGRIELLFSNSAGAVIGSDRFAFTVLSPGPPLRRGVVLYDPAGTAGQTTGFAEKVVRTPDFSEARKVMIAPGALSFEALQAIPEAVPVLVLEQEAGQLEKLGFHMFPIRARQFWPDLLLAIDPELLRDWRSGRPIRIGQSHLPLRKGYLYTSSTTGMVAESVFETPNAGNFTPLAHGGFDLALTPLLLTDLGGRRVIFSQLALAENAAIDPGAGRVLNRLLELLACNPDDPPGDTRTALRQTGQQGCTHLPTEKKSPPHVVGDVEFAESLGAVSVRRGFPERGTVLVTEIGNPSELSAFLARGGKAVLMPQPDEVYHKLGISFEHLATAYLPQEFAGLNAGNFHFRQDLPVLAFGGKLLARHGNLTLVGFDPRKIDTAAEPYLALTQKRQYRAIAQALTNAGMALDAPAQSLLSALECEPLRLPIADTMLSMKLRETRDDDGGWRSGQYDDGAWQDYDFRKSASTGKPDVQIRIRFCVDADDAARKGLQLDAGTFDDYSELYLNGVKVGAVTPENSQPEQAWQIRRVIPIPDGLLKAGENLLAIHVWNRNGQTRGWPAQMRGPLEITEQKQPRPLYFGKYRHCDDPYMVRLW